MSSLKSTLTPILKSKDKKNYLKTVSKSLFLLCNYDWVLRVRKSEIKKAIFTSENIIMRIDIVTVLPIEKSFEASIMKRAIDKGLVEVHFHNLRDYTTNKQKC
jgi:hypothetical protein